MTTAGGALLFACAKNTVSDSACGSGSYCECGTPTATVAGTTGTGKIFKLDPMVDSGNSVLSPGSSTVGNFTSTTTLTNLTGLGVLKGSYVDVVTDKCVQNYGARSATNSFSYSHSDERFNEVQAYYHGNNFRSELSASGALYPSSTFLMIANCDVTDNAYYTIGQDNSGAIIPYVCLGKSSNYSATTTFSDDSAVIVHEMQHGVTGAAYSTTEDFNKLSYDEAGAMNEAISDFVGLMQADPEIVSPFKNTDFSRWALGQFFTSGTLLRGAAKCPIWSPDYPACASFSKTSTGFSAAARRVSFAYPDGLGWPYAGPAASATLKDVWTTSSGFEEIHQSAPVFTGALFDVFLALKTSTGDGPGTKRRLLRLVMETIKGLPKYSTSNPSPVTMPKFAADMNTLAGAGTAGTFSGPEQTLIANALAARGLTGIPLVADGWASVGAGTVAAPGVFFYESLAVGVADNRLKAGEKGAIWFDISNSSANTAAAPLIKVTSSDARVKFSGATQNPGYISNTVAFTRYSKINGSNIVGVMNNGTAAQNTGMTVRYFGNSSTLTGVNIDTALYIEIAAGTPSGTVVNFTVVVDPVNKTSTASTLTFPVTLQ